MVKTAYQVMNGVGFCFLTLCGTFVNGDMQSRILSDVTMNVSVSQGSTAVLPCRITDLRDRKVVWIDRFSTLLTLDNRRVIDDPRISVERPFTESWDLHIRETKPSDSGEYICQVGPVPKRSITVRLHVKEGPRFLDEDVVEINIKSGSTAVLPCKIAHLGHHKVAWINPKYTLLTFGDSRVIDDNRISVGRPYEQDFQLNIRDVTSSDSGDYTCQINTTPVQSKVVRLTVEDVDLVPYFESTISEINVMVGRTATLPCRVINLGSHTVTWRKRPYKVPLTVGLMTFIAIKRFSVDQSNTDWNLLIKDVQQNDEGVYSCIVTIGSSQLERNIVLKIIDDTTTVSVLPTTQTITTTGTTFFTNAMFPTTAEKEDMDLTPYFGSTGSEINAMVGQTASLPCQVIHLGTRSVVWRRRPDTSPLAVGLMTFTNDRRFEVDQSKTYWNLRIKDVRPIDAGHYVCMVSRKSSPMEKVVLLNVIDQTTTVTIPTTTTTLAQMTLKGMSNASSINDESARITYYSKDVTVGIGRDVVLWCKTDGYSEVTVVWYKLHGRSIWKEKVSKTPTGILKIRNVSREDSGEYECVAYKGLGVSDNRHVTLDVEFPPSVAVTSNTTVKEGVSQSLDCQITGHPIQYYAWTIHGRRIYDSDIYKLSQCRIGDFTIMYTLDITIPSPENSIFTCEAINKYGVTTATFIINDLTTTTKTQLSTILTTETPVLDPMLLLRGPMRMEGTALVTQGNRIHLRCILPNPDRLSVDINWIFNGDIIPDLVPKWRERIVISNETNENGAFTSLLVIPGSRMEDSGTYACRSTYLDFSSMSVRVNNGPMEIEGSMAVAKEDPITLRCKINNPDRALVDVDWFSRGIKINLSNMKWRHRTTISTKRENHGDVISELFLNKSTIDDEGMYICRSTNLYVGSTFVQVGSTPVRLEGSSSVTEGDQIHLICTVNNPDQASFDVLWYHGEGPQKIISEGRWQNRVMITNRWKESGIFVSELIIKNSTLDDQGVYICYSYFSSRKMVVRVKKGYSTTTQKAMYAAESSFPAPVLSDDSNLEIYPGSTAVVEGSIFHFFCNMKRATKVIYVWERNGRQIAKGRKRYEAYTTDDGAVLKIDPVRYRKDNDAEFACIATVESTVTRVTAKLSVIQATYLNYAENLVGFPRITVQPKVSAIELGRTTNLQCEAKSSKASQHPRIRWMKNGENVRLDERRSLRENSGSLVIKNVSRSDQGMYYCVAENSIGTAYSNKVPVYVKEDYYEVERFESKNNENNGNEEDNSDDNNNDIGNGAGGDDDDYDDDNDDYRDDIIFKLDEDDQ